MHEFHETQMGQQFYGGTMPRIAGSLEDIAGALTEIRDAVKQESEPAGDDAVHNIDWSCLRKQKLWLLDQPDCDEKDGLVALLDAIQDEAVEVYGLSEAEIFGDTSDD